MMVYIYHHLWSNPESRSLRKCYHPPTWPDKPAIQVWWPEPVVCFADVPPHISNQAALTAAHLMHPWWCKLSPQLAARVKLRGRTGVVIARVMGCLRGRWWWGGMMQGVGGRGSRGKVDLRGTGRSRSWLKDTSRSLHALAGLICHRSDIA